MKNILLTFAFSAFFTVSIFAQGLKIGDQAPDFTLKNVDGSMISLSDYNSEKGVVVIFTCNHCPYAIAYEDRIIELNNKYAPMGYPVVAINPNDPAVQPQDSYELMQARSKEKGFTFPYLFDEGQKVYPTYGATRTPHVYLLQNTGEVFKLAYIGTIDDNYQEADKVEDKYLENAIRSLINGGTPDPAETKAIGCSIKVKKS